MTIVSMRKSSTRDIRRLCQHEDQANMVHTGTSHHPNGQRGQWTSPLSYYRPGPRKGREGKRNGAGCDARRYEPQCKGDEPKVTRRVFGIAARPAQ